MIECYNDCITEIWQASQQHYCRGACQISERLEKIKPGFQDFTRSCGKTSICLMNRGPGYNTSLTTDTLLITKQFIYTIMQTMCKTVQNITRKLCRRPHNSKFMTKGVFMANYHGIWTYKSLCSYCRLRFTCSGRRYIKRYKSVCSHFTYLLTQCGLLSPYCIGDLDQHWFR